MQNTFLKHKLLTPLKPAIGPNKKLPHGQNSVRNGYEGEWLELQPRIQYYDNTLQLQN